MTAPRRAEGAPRPAPTLAMPCRSSSSAVSASPSVSKSSAWLFASETALDTEGVQSFDGNRRRAEEEPLPGNARSRRAAGGDTALEVADDGIAVLRDLTQL